MPTSGYSRSETMTSSGGKEIKKAAQNVATTTTRQGLTPYQFLERFAQKFPRKSGSSEILPDFSSNFVENTLDRHPHVRPLTTIATQSLIPTTSVTTTTTSTTTSTTTIVGRNTKHSPRRSIAPLPHQWLHQRTFRCLCLFIAVGLTSPGRS